MTISQIPIPFSTPGAVYTVGKGAFDCIGEVLLERCRRPRRAIVVSDEQTILNQGMLVCASLIESGFKVFDYALPKDDEIRKPVNVAQLLEAVSTNRFSSSDIVVAVGGVEVMMLAGALADQIYSGVDLVLVPTTFEAALVPGCMPNYLKSSGGVLISWSHRAPIAAFADLDHIAREEDTWRAGCARLVQIGVLHAQETFDEVCGLAAALTDHDAEALARAVVLGSQAAFDLVSASMEDEFDSSGWVLAVRKALLFGTVFATAVDRMQSAGGKLPDTGTAGVYGTGHLGRGDLLAEGMRFELDMVDDRGSAALQGLATDLDHTLEALGMPRLYLHPDPDELVDSMRSFDLRPRGSQLVQYVYAPGDTSVQKVAEQDLRQHVRSYCELRR